MIQTFRHKGLRLFEDGDPSGVQAVHVGKLLRIMARVHATRVVSDMNLPGIGSIR